MFDQLKSQILQTAQGQFFINIIISVEKELSVSFGDEKKKENFPKYFEK